MDILQNRISIFEFTGETKEILLFPGKYQFEVYGASAVYFGGLGGYVKGTLKTTSNLYAYLNVGGSNGWNGGGTAPTVSRNGGGGTDVRIGDNSLASRIIVAGGGGGGTPYRYGGAGGGLTGVNGSQRCGSPGLGASQTAGGGGPYPGSLGQGGNGGFGNGSQGAGGGGGGYYGGGGGSCDGSGDDDSSGGGGSGYLDPNLIDTEMQTGVNTGDGKIIITVLWQMQVNVPANTSGLCVTNELIDTNSTKVINVTSDAVSMKDTELTYVISPDNKATWNTYKNNKWISISKSKYISDGLTSQELNALTEEEFNKLPQGLFFIMVCFYTSAENTSSELVSLKVTTVPRNKRHDVKFFVSNNNKSTWLSYLNSSWTFVDLSEVNKAMSYEVFSSLSKEIWNEILKDSLDVAVVLISNDPGTTPEINTITFNREQFQEILNTDSISIPVPNSGFRNTLTDPVNITYTLSIADGIAFDDKDVDYNFYTTPDRIHLRPLDMGVFIGGRNQNIYGVEVINGYMDKKFHIILTGMTSDKKEAEIKDNFGLLYDSDTEDGRTKFELSNVEDMSVINYPLEFNLNAGEKKIVYLRITPTIYNTVGTKQVKLKLIGRPI